MTEETRKIFEAIAKGNAGPEPYDRTEEGESKAAHDEWEYEWKELYDRYVEFYTEED
jgi:hypothetical protein